MVNSVYDIKSVWKIHDRAGQTQHSKYKSKICVVERCIAFTLVFTTVTCEFICTANQILYMLQNVPMSLLCRE